MDLSIIIVSYNTADLIAACLQSLESGFSGKREIFVVDNASTDGSADFIRDNFPSINLISNPVNRGFAAANNQGLSECRGKYVFFLNPDTVVMPGAMDKAVSYMDKNINVGLAGVRIVNPDGTKQESVSYRYPSETYTRGDLKELKGAIACVLGAAMIARRECLKIVGGFDDDFFLYGEDQDLCLRIRRQGHEIGYADASVVVHISGQSERQTPLAALWKKKVSAEYLFYRKHYLPETIRRIVRAELVRTRFRLAILRLTMPFARSNGKTIEKLTKYRVISEAIRTEQQAAEGRKKPALPAADEPRYCPAESYTGKIGNVLERRHQGVTGGRNGSSATVKPKISVILTAWQRPQYLEEQVERIFSQTVVPCEIVLWYNKPSQGKGLADSKQLVHFKNDHRVKKIICDYNFGIIPRFTLASCMEGDYVCIFDDDTMPGTRWLENCLNFVDAEQALCGTIGIRYLSKTELKTQKPRMGWEGMNDRIEFVDLVGHSWFFRKTWAKYFWDVDPFSREFGEDIHFCAMLQRHGIRAICPPHPKGDHELWGSVRPERGIDDVAISCSSDKSHLFWQVVKYELEKGYKPVLL